MDPVRARLAILVSCVIAAVAVPTLAAAQCAPPQSGIGLPTGERKFYLASNVAGTPMAQTIEAAVDAINAQLAANGVSGSLKKTTGDLSALPGWHLTRTTAGSCSIETATARSAMGESSSAMPRR